MPDASGDSVWKKAWSWLKHRPRWLKLQVNVRAPELAPPAALLASFLGVDTAYYPRVNLTGKAEETLNSPGVMGAVGAELSQLNLTRITTKEAEKLHDLYRSSLDEAKGQTEYQDQKSTRLLTVISVFSAISGIMFSKFIEYYPLSDLYTRTEFFLVVSVYFVFWAFIFCVISGAVVIYHANRTRFLYDFTSHQASGKIRSRLFYLPISKTEPAAWASQIAEWQARMGPNGRTGGASDEESRLVREATLDYLKDCVLEAYLVACKVADKVRYLKPAQQWLAWSTKLFLIWIVLLAAAIAYVDRPPEKSQPPAGLSIAVTATAKASDSKLNPPPPRCATKRSEIGYR